MDIFGKIGETITETSKDVSQKVTDLTEITKLRMDIRNKEEFVRRQYSEIGKQYYEMHKDDAQPLFEEITLITETLQKIEELRSGIAERKGKKLCPVCSAPNDADALYCNKCGNKCEFVYAEDEEDFDAAGDAAENMETAEAVDADVAGDIQIEEDKDIEDV
jgi:hypothetical protein